MVALVSALDLIEKHLKQKKYIQEQKKTASRAVVSPGVSFVSYRSYLQQYKSTAARTTNLWFPRSWRYCLHSPSYAQTNQSLFLKKGHFLCCSSLPFFLYRRVRRYKDRCIFDVNDSSYKKSGRGMVERPPLALCAAQNTARGTKKSRNNPEPKTTNKKM